MVWLDTNLSGFFVARYPSSIMAKTKKAFRIGDKVRFSQFVPGPWMHVISIGKKGGKVKCQWFTATGQFQEVSFQPEFLETYDEVAERIPADSEPNIVEGTKTMGMD